LNAANADAATTWSPLAADEQFDGKPLEDWAIAWRRWAYSQTDCEQDTRFDETGALCALHQADDAPVFFFDRGPPGTLRNECQVPPDRAIVVPIAMYSIDNAGVSNALSDEELSDAATGAVMSVRDMVFEVDGKRILDLDRRRFGPTRTSYYIPNAPNWYSCRMADGIADTTVEPVYLSGVLAVLPPPSVGSHVVRYGSTLTLRNGDPSRSEVTVQFHIE